MNEISLGKVNCMDQGAMETLYRSCSPRPGYMAKELEIDRSRGHYNFCNEQGGQVGCDTVEGVFQEAVRVGFGER